MRISDWLTRWISRRTPPGTCPAVIDYVQIRTVKEDWRLRKLAAAAERHGRPFKCAADDLPHETIMHSRARAGDD